MKHDPTILEISLFFKGSGAVFRISSQLLAVRSAGIASSFACSVQRSSWAVEEISGGDVMDFPHVFHQGLVEPGGPTK